MKKIEKAQAIELKVTGKNSGTLRAKLERFLAMGREIGGVYGRPATIAACGCILFPATTIQTRYYAAWRETFYCPQHQNLCLACLNGKKTRKIHE